MSGKLWLKEKSGPISAGPFSAQMRTTLAPGDTAPVLVPLDRRLPDGPWKARLTLASGRVERTVTATVTFPRAGTWGSSIIPDFTQWPPMLSWGLGTVPAILAAFGIRHLKGRRPKRRHRRRRPRRLRTPGPVGP